MGDRIVRGTHTGKNVNPTEFGVFYDEAFGVTRTILPGVKMKAGDAIKMTIRDGKVVDFEHVTEAQAARERIDEYLHARSGLSQATDCIIGAETVIDGKLAVGNLNAKDLRVLIAAHKADEQRFIAIERVMTTVCRRYGSATGARHPRRQG